MAAIRKGSTLDIGRRFDARPLLLPWPGCPHVLIGGETGSGKSGVCNSIIGAAAGHPNVAICGIDLKLVELSRWRPRLTALATTPPQAARLLVAFRDLLTVRSRFMELHGHRMWRGEFGPWILFLADELAELQAVDADLLADAIDADDGGRKALAAGKSGQQVLTALFGSLARMARSCGITIVGATQYPSAEVVDQQIRTQMAIRIMLRVASGEQINVILGHGYGNQISPNSIGPSERGGLWIMGIDNATTPTRGRAHWVSDDDVTARVAATAHLTPAYAQVFGPPPSNHTEEANT